MTGEVVHGLQPARQLRHPGGKDGMWVASCACGEYTSRPCGWPRHAERSVEDHVRDKTKGSQG